MSTNRDLLKSFKIDWKEKNVKSPKRKNVPRSPTKEIQRTFEASVRGQNLPVFEKQKEYRAFVADYNFENGTNYVVSERNNLPRSSNAVKYINGEPYAKVSHFKYFSSMSPVGYDGIRQNNMFKMPPNQWANAMKQASEDAMVANKDKPRKGICRDEAMKIGAQYIRSTPTKYGIRADYKFSPELNERQKKARREKRKSAKKAKQAAILEAYRKSQDYLKAAGKGSNSNRSRSPLKKHDVETPRYGRALDRLQQRLSAKKSKESEKGPSVTGRAREDERADLPDYMLVDASNDSNKKFKKN